MRHFKGIVRMPMQLFTQLEVILKPSGPVDWKTIHNVTTVSFSIKMPLQFNDDSTNLRN